MSPLTTGRIGQLMQINDKRHIDAPPEASLKVSKIFLVDRQLIGYNRA